MKTTTIASLCVLLLGAARSMADAPSGYAVDDKIRLDGDLGWDLLAVDDSTGRIFLSHGDRIDVADARTGAQVGSVSGLKGAHGVALVPDLNRGFATSGKDSTVVEFDLKTLAVVARIPAGGAKPDAILFDPASRRVFVGLAGSNALSAIDASTSKLVGTVHLDGNPELMAVDGKGKLYVAVENRSQVVTVDARTLSKLSTWPLAPGEEPTGLALDEANGRLFTGCDNHMVVVLDATSGKVITHLPVGDHVDGVAFDPGLGRAYVSAGDGTLTVVQEDGKDSFRVLETVKTRKGAKTLAVDSRTHHVYLPTAQYGPVPAATAESPKPKAPILPGTFVVLDVHPVR